VSEKAIRNILNEPTIPMLIALNESIGVSSVEARFVMGELEYRFSKHPEGFYMAYERQSELSGSQAGESWYERLAFTPTETKFGFDTIGVRYDSHREFMSAEDKFKGKYYCSFYDPKRKQAFYLRNHPLADAAIKKALGGKTVAEMYDAYEQTAREHRERVLEKVERKKQDGETDFSDLFIEAMCVE
jgi:hypothetical protein